MRHAFFLLWLTIAAVTSPLLSHQVEDLSTEDDTLLQRRQSADAPFAITGITDTGIQPRLEIRQLQQDADAFNVFLLGLQRFMSIDQTEKLSFYQIAGVHGRPHVPWDGVGGTGDSGYCPHASNLFLTWHRAYLLLIEQVLFDSIIDVVNEFPAGTTRQKYASAAMRWRLPYWDWAAPPADGQDFPSALRSPTANVTMPNGTHTISNPLYSYKFHPVSEQDFLFDPWADWTETMRNPTNMTETAVSNDDALGPILGGARNSMMNRLYNLFTYYSNYTQFGNEAWQSSNVANADSLESLHSVVHNIIGNQGHMTWFDYSAFDPIFWLHHSMVDRCFALWQAVHRNSTMENRTAVAQTFTINPGDPEDPTTPLDPFHKSTDGLEFTSVDMWGMTKYGYTYPELIGNPTTATVKAAINRLYGSNAAAGGNLRRGILPSSHAASTATKEDTETMPEAFMDGRYCSYVTNIVSQKFTIHGSYLVYVFLGDPGSDDAAQWPLSPNFVGMHGVFAGFQSPGAAMVHHEIKVAGTVPLNDALLAKISSRELLSMDSELVASFLQENLHWRIAMPDGTRVDAQDVPDLSVTVFRAEVQPAACEEEFPRWGQFTELRRATEGRVGGIPRL